MIYKTHTRNQRRMYRIHKMEEQIEKDKYIIGSQQQEITRLNNIIKEAIEYIKNNIDNTGWLEIGVSDVEHLLNILQGEDK